MNPAEFAYLEHAERDMWWFRGMNRMLFAMIDRFSPGDRQLPVLEVGCGTGYLGSLLEERLGWRITGLDLGTEALKLARPRLRNLVQADLRALPFQAQSFKALVSMDVLVHLERGEEGIGLGEFYRVVEPGGVVFLRVAALDVLRSRHSEFAHERQRFTKPRLVSAVRHAGFEVLRTTYMNSLLMPIALFKFRVWEPLTRQAPASGVYEYSRLLNRILELPLRAESGIVERGWNLPLGQSLFVIARRPLTP